MVKTAKRENQHTTLDRMITIQMMPRIEKLRNAFLNLKPSGSIDRARIETRVMKETEGEPVITRRARVFAATVREMPIYIFPGQLLVGSTGARPLCHNVLPGLNAVGKSNSYYVMGYREDLPFVDLRVEEKKELEELTSYWKEQGRLGKISHYGHNIHNHLKVVQKGFLGIKKDAEDRLSRLDLSKAEDAAKVPFLEGVILVMEAASGIGKRYADLARELAKEEKDARRKAELLEIAEVCDWVPANPARTFCEALQAYYLSFMLLHWEVVTQGFSMGRIDQYLYAYFENDIREGRLTREEAQELIDCYLLGVNFEKSSSPITVGGVKVNGQNATNDLSYMFIEGMMHTRLPSPWLTVLVHSQMPDELLIRACQLSSLGTGQPQFVNNDILVAQALARGDMGGPVVTLEDARSASPQGCFELVIPGKDSGYLYNYGPNLATCMEFVMTNGVLRHDKAQIGPKTGDPRQFKSFDEFREAMGKQIAWLVKNYALAANLGESAGLQPTVFASALTEDCIEKGVAKEKGGARYNVGIFSMLGTVDAGNSLAAIKKLVYDDKKVTMDRLCKAMENNFVGYEDVRKMCLEAPKFGNDDDYADEQVAWITHLTSTEARKYRTPYGGPKFANQIPLSGFLPAGLMVGALPSGKAG